MHMDADTLIEKYRTRLQRHRGQLSRVAEVSGLSPSWISKFGCGHMTNPNIRSLESLGAALDALEAETASKAA